MIIKKFVAETMNEALAQVKQELGEDAVILQSRKVEKGGLLNLMSKEMVEVTAATPDRNPIPPKRKSPAAGADAPGPRTPKPPRAPSPSGAPQRPYGVRNYESTDRDTRRRDLLEEEAPPAPAFPSRREPAGRSAPGRRDDEDVKQMRSELRDLRTTVQELADQLRKREEKAPTDLPGELQNVLDGMLENGVESAMAQALVKALREKLSDEDLEDGEQVESQLHDLLAEEFRVGAIELPTARAGRPKVVALIGPTGVGKTTTLAKLATNRRIFGNRKVALISADTYRVAAVEQLKTFAGIAGLPMEVVYRPEDLPRAIERHQDKDVVLVDTAGRSHNDTDALNELRAFLDAGIPDEIVLVLAANVRPEDQRDIVRKFGVMPATSVIVSKLDEVSSGGQLLTMMDMFPRPWLYMTTGQDVPEDIVPADRLLLAAMVARRDYYDQLRQNDFVLPTLDDETVD